MILPIKRIPYFNNTEEAEEFGRNNPKSIVYLFNKRYSLLKKINKTRHSQKRFNLIFQAQFCREAIQVMRTI
jgi:hypothetical protein